jgi:hypothetical protein
MNVELNLGELELIVEALNQKHDALNTLALFSLITTLLLPVDTTFSTSMRFRSLDAQLRQIPAAVINSHLVNSAFITHLRLSDSSVSNRTDTVAERSAKLSARINKLPFHKNIPTAFIEIVTDFALHSVPLNSNNFLRVLRLC